MKGFKKQKDDSNMNIHRGILGCVFVGCEGPCRDGSCNPCVCSHGNGSIWGVQWMEEVAHGRPRYSSLLGKHSKRSCVRKVGHWRNLLKKISGASRRSFCIQTRICSRLGFGFLADHGCGTVPVPKETTQITSSSHNTNLTNHIHLTHQAIAILHWWDDTAHHCCSVNLLGLGMTHIACLPPDPTVHVAWL